MLDIVCPGWHIGYSYKLAMQISSIIKKKLQLNQNDFYLGTKYNE